MRVTFLLVFAATTNANMMECISFLSVAINGDHQTAIYRWRRYVSLLTDKTIVKTIILKSPFYSYQLANIMTRMSSMSNMHPKLTGENAVLDSFLVLSW